MERSPNSGVGRNPTVRVKKAVNWMQLAEIDGGGEVVEF
jgi:hypothetical protein